MDRDKILEALQEVFRDMLDDDDFILDPNLKREDLPEWDSLFHITLTASAADEFGIKISSNDIVNIKSIDSLIDVIEKEIQ